MTTATITVRAIPGLMSMLMSIANSGLVPDYPVDETGPRHFLPCNCCLNEQVPIKQYPGFELEAEGIHCGRYQNDQPMAPLLIRSGYHRAAGRL